MDSQKGINSLPSEIVHEIIGYLNQKPLKACCLVSQPFFDCSAPRLWRKIQFPILPHLYTFLEDRDRRRFLKNLKAMSSYIESAPSTRPYAAFVKEIDLCHSVSLEAFDKQLLPFLNQNLKKFTNLRHLSLAPLNAKLIRNETSIVVFGGKVVAFLKANLPMLKKLEYLSFPCGDIQTLCLCLQVNEEFLNNWLKIESIHLRQLSDRFDLLGRLVDISRNIQEIDIGFEEASSSTEITIASWSKIIRSRLLRRINVFDISFLPETAIKATSTPSVTSLSITIYQHSFYIWQKWLFESLPRLTDLEIIESDTNAFYTYYHDKSWLEPILQRLKSLTYVGTGNYIHEFIGMARNLESLSLKRISQLDLSHLNKLRQLKELTIDRCWMSEECGVDFAKLLGSMTTIRQLTVTGSYTVKFYQYLFENINHVRILSIDFHKCERPFKWCIVSLAKYFRLHPDESLPQTTITIPAESTFKKERWYSVFPKSFGIVHFRRLPKVYNDYDLFPEDMLMWD